MFPRLHLVALAAFVTIGAACAPHGEAADTAALDTAPSDTAWSGADAKAVGSCATAPSSANCDGQDPNATGCATGATTVRSDDIVSVWGEVTVGRLELRWSPTCRTNWTRVVYSPSGFPVVAKVQRRSDMRTYTATGSGTTTYTPMVYAPSTTACAHSVTDLGGSVSENSGWICR